MIKDSIRDKKNMVKVSEGIYLVRTQAGFVGAVQDHFSEEFSDWHLYLKTMSGHPTSYPSIVTLSLGYNGDHQFVCHACHVNRMKEVIDGQ